MTQDEMPKGRCQVLSTDLPMAAVWEISKEPGHCSTCGKDVPTGSRVFPQEGKGGQVTHVHHRCAARAAAAAGLPRPVPPVCRDWLAGCCLFRDTCILLHPPPATFMSRCAGVPAGAPTAAPMPGADTAVAALQGYEANRRGGKVLKRFRTGVFRRFLLETFGAQLLRDGAGVLDVAGGRGELAFELLNLHGIRATVLEPRPIDVQQRAEVLAGGFYEWRSGGISSSGVDEPWNGGSGTQQQEEEGAARQRQQQQQHAAAGRTGEDATAASGGSGGCRGSHSSSKDKLLLPQQLRAVVTSQLASCLTDALAAASNNGGGGTGSLAGRPDMPADWPRLFAAARQEARSSRWAGPAVGHGNGASRQGGRQHQEHQQQQQQEEEQAGAPLQEGQASKTHTLAQTAATGAAAAGGSRQAAELAELPRVDPPVPQEVVDPQQAWDLLTSASIVVGIHTDEATDFVVDLAVAANKPFAVVPCCVHAAAFPWRRVAGRPVSSYEDLIEWLVSKDPQHIRTAMLPVEGRSCVVYRLPQ